MRKEKYFYNPSTLQYEKIQTPLSARLWQAFGFLCAVLVFAFLIVVLAFEFIDSPKEKKLKREIALLQSQYEFINKEMKLANKVLAELQDRDDNFYRVIFEAEPIPSSVREAGIGGSNPYSELEGFTNSDLLLSTRKNLDKIKRQVYVQSKSYDKVATLLKNREDLYRSMPAVQPISNKNLKHIASGFGIRIHPIYKTHRMHSGLDFSAPTGTPVYATGKGKVVSINDVGSGYGNHILIDHGYNFKTLYAHLSNVNVKVGQTISRGDLIGKVGNTGLSTAPHLHYEVWKGGKPVNPAMYFYNDLSPAEYQTMIKLSSKFNQSFD